MTRMVTCRRYKEALEGLDRPPLPGAKGQDIFDHVSKKAWLEWLLTGWHVAFDLIESLAGEEFIHLTHQVLTRISIN